jgi:hypothetical protein
MHDKGRRPFRFVLLILILAIAAFVALRPGSSEKKNPTPSAPANASRQRATSAATVDAKPATPPGPFATSNGSVSPLWVPELAPMRIDVQAPATVRAGEAFQATVDVDAGRGIRKLEFTVRFDKRVLQLVGSPAGTFVQHAALPAEFEAQEPSDGVVLVNFDVDNGLAVAGSGSVVILEFLALKAGTSPVTVDSITLAEAGRDGTSTMPSLTKSLITVE